MEVYKDLILFDVVFLSRRVREESFYIYFDFKKFKFYFVRLIKVDGVLKLLKFIIN